MSGRVVHSMTGSGCATGPCELGRVTIEFRSVNGRNLSLRFRTAPECSGIESAVEQRARSRFLRGTVTVAMDVDESSRSATQSVCSDAFREAAARLIELAKHSRLPVPEVRDVLAMPGVVSTPTSERTRTSWEPSAEFLTLIDAALDQLSEHRAAEGRETVAAMNVVLAQFGEVLEEVRSRVPQIVAAHRATILGRVNEFLSQHGTQLEPDHVIREVALFADRVDVAEEVQRLDAHIERLSAKLGGGGPVGRDVEFLLQEMFREVNTLGSKSPDVEVAHRVVAMKSSIDKLKEQAANLE